MSVTQQISAETYEKLALTEPDRKWELVDGHLREKPAMTFAHNTVADDLGFLLTTQLDRAEYRVRVDKGHVRRPGATYFIPDVFVFPLTLVTPRLRQDDVLEVYDDPLPLVVEIWSPTTGDYDVDVKLPVYQERGDLEIWLVHPSNRTISSWIRQSDGSYVETIHRAGIVYPVALPTVAIDLSALFES